MKKFLKDYWYATALMLLFIVLVAVNIISKHYIIEPQQPNIQAIIDSIRLKENERSIKIQDSIISANLILLEKERKNNAKKYADLQKRYEAYQTLPKDTVFCCEALLACDSVLNNSVQVAKDLDTEVNKCNEVVFELEVACEKRDTSIVVLERLLTNNKKENLMLKQQIDRINKKPSFWAGFGVGFIAGSVSYILINK